jgi:hypothetical protein
MAKNSSSGGCGVLILIALGALALIGGLPALGQVPYGVTVLAVLAVGVFVVVLVVIVASSSSGMRAPSKTETSSTTLLGDKKRTIQYHDTGKEVQQNTSSDWLGRKTRKTYVTKPGRQRQRVRHQTCWDCGASVASTDGSYHCACGNRWPPGHQRRR